MGNLGSVAHDIVKLPSTPPNDAAHWVDLQFVLLFFSDLHLIGSHYSQNSVGLITCIRALPINVFIMWRMESQKMVLITSSVRFFPMLDLNEIEPKKKARTRTVRKWVCLILFAEQKRRINLASSKESVFIFTPYRLTLLSIHSIVSHSFSFVEFPALEPYAG